MNHHSLRTEFKNLVKEYEIVPSTAYLALNYFKGVHVKL